MPGAVARQKTEFGSTAGCGTLSGDYLSLGAGTDIARLQQGIENRGSADRGQSRLFAAAPSPGNPSTCVNYAAVWNDPGAVTGSESTYRAPVMGWDHGRRDKGVGNVRVTGADGAQVGKFDVEAFNSIAWRTPTV